MTHKNTSNKECLAKSFKEQQMIDFFDVCMTVRHWYSNINNQLDATITVY